MVTADEKISIYLKIAALYLEDGDAVQAETYVNRATAFIPDTKDALLVMQHKVSMHGDGRTCMLTPLTQVHQARIQDSKRKVWI